METGIFAKIKGKKGHQWVFNAAKKSQTRRRALVDQ